MFKSICKSIYTEAGFNGIVTALRMFPERLHDEILEELSMNMCEWEYKLSSEEKDNMEKNLSIHAISLSLQDIDTLNSLKATLSHLYSETTNVEEKRESLIRNIEEFPSLLPETDIDNISIIDDELDSIKKRVLDIEEYIESLSSSVDQKTVRRNDTLFQ